MASVKTKIIVSIIAVAVIFFIYASSGGNSGGDFFSIGDSFFGDISLFPSKSAFNPLSSILPDGTPAPPLEQPVSPLTIYLNSKAAVSVGGTVLVYTCTMAEGATADGTAGWMCGTPVADVPLLELPVEYGKAVYAPFEPGDVNGTSLLQTNTPYAIHFRANRHFYDADLGKEMFVSSGEAGSGEHTLLYEVDAVGSLVDPLDETKAINGQPTTDLNLPTVELGCYGGCDDDETLFYSKAKGDGEITMDLTIACGGYGAVCRDVVLYFNFGFPKPEGNELLGVKINHLSGVNFHLPTDLMQYFDSQGGNLYIGDMVSGQSSKYRLQFTFREVAIDHNDPFGICLDDLNRGAGIYGGEGAKPVEVKMGFVD